MREVLISCKNRSMFFSSASHSNRGYPWCINHWCSMWFGKGRLALLLLMEFFILDKNIFFVLNFDDMSCAKYKVGWSACVCVLMLYYFRATRLLNWFLTLCLLGLATQNKAITSHKLSANDLHQKQESKHSYLFRFSLVTPTTKSFFTSWLKQFKPTRLIMIFESDWKWCLLG